MVAFMTILNLGLQKVTCRGTLGLCGLTFNGTFGSDGDDDVDDDGDDTGSETYNETYISYSMSMMRKENIYSCHL